MTKAINIGRDFTSTPIGRYRADSRYSGQVFREDHLMPALSDFNFSKIIVDLAGVEGYGSSFLEEAFGGLIRAKITKDTLDSRLEIMSSDPLFNRFVEYANDYINEAARRV
jgi:hypothetical protein